jgi:uncharacterized protein YuzE
MYLTYDETADAVYVYFERRDVDRTDQLTDRVNVDYAADGIPVGVEFLDVSLGIDLDNVPHRADVARLLDERHFRVFA